MAVQSQMITTKILQDAYDKGEEIKNSYSLKAQQILLEAKNFEQQKQKELKQTVKLMQLELEDRYSTLAKIEGNKIVLKTKQKLLQSVKNQALNFILAWDKQKILDFVDKLIKLNAEASDKVVFNLKDISVEDIQSLNSVSGLDLKCQKDNSIDYGVVLIGNTCDKNLLFCSLIENEYMKHENDICKILFN
ncbi:MAG: hypothetical protein IJD48_02805 [Clostridia bacterium]|nr:hypothetical protein [Clostridia bacterium]